MALVLGIIAFLVATVALAIAAGVSLGRNGDREDEYHFRSELEEQFRQVLDRVAYLEDLHPQDHIEDELPPDEPA